MEHLISKSIDTSTRPQDIFVELFSQVFGIEKVQLLSPEHPVRDIEGNSRFIDFALKTIEDKFAFEIDGLVWHHPEAVTIKQYEDGLLRQNSLVYSGWKIFRWTDRELAEEPEKVKEQLALFLEQISGSLEFDEFLPKQHGELLELRSYQKEALERLAQMRLEGKSIALLPHATGTGKTIISIIDAKLIGGRTLYIAHRKDLLKQTYRKFKELWPEVECGFFMGDEQNLTAHVVIGSIQSVSGQLQKFGKKDFQYLIIDEAHHAAARTYRRILSYFEPDFILGLTATPERADNQSILELFRESAHRLTLREAIEQGDLVPIRCVRVLTNVDLKKIRFNEVQYNQKDIETTIMIPARDRLIVKTYLDHAPGKRAVNFCVNIKHGENLAALYRENSVKADSVSGRLSQSERDRILKDFKMGNIDVLCACDILNEGWDCPEIEVLLMARPTLSKVVYLQQLGRGTRKSPGKEHLLVFDFVDNATRYNAPQSIHRIVGERKYRPGGLVIAPPDIKGQEEELIASGEKPPISLEIGLWTKEYQEIDLFNWQEAIKDMITVNELEIELSTSHGFIKRAIERNEIRPDHILKLGERIYYYFQCDRKEEIRVILNIPKVDKSTLKRMFLEYVREMDISSSYKPVMLLAILDSIDKNGHAKISDVTTKFRSFYLNRVEAGLLVEKGNIRMARVNELDDQDIQQIVLSMPFEKFERRKYLQYDLKNLSNIQFNNILWKQIQQEDIIELRKLCENAIAKYYNDE